MLTLQGRQAGACPTVTSNINRSGVLTSVSRPWHLFRKWVKEMTTSEQLHLIDSIYNNDLTEVKRIISLGMDLDFKNDYGATPLIIAVCMGGGMVEVLLDAGADIDFPGESPASPLYHALISRNTDCVHLLLTRGARIHPCERGMNALHVAIELSSFSCFSIVVSFANKDDLERLDDTGRTPLMVAVECELPQFVEELINSGVDINFYNEAGWAESALQLAARSGNEEIIKILVKHGADLEHRDGYGRRPIDLYLREASSNANLDTVRLLTPIN